MNTNENVNLRYKIHFLFLISVDAIFSFNHNKIDHSIAKDIGMAYLYN